MGCTWNYGAITGRNQKLVLVGRSGGGGNYVHSIVKIILIGLCALNSVNNTDLVITVIRLIHHQLLSCCQHFDVSLAWQRKKKGKCGFPHTHTHTHTKGQGRAREGRLLFMLLQIQRLGPVVERSV